MRVIGVSLDIKNSPEIILPLMDERDLLAYLRTRNNIISYKTVRIWPLNYLQAFEHSQLLITNIFKGHPIHL